MQTTLTVPSKRIQYWCRLGTGRRSSKTPLRSPVARSCMGRPTIWVRRPEVGGPLKTTFHLPRLSFHWLVDSLHSLIRGGIWHWTGTTLEEERDRASRKQHRNTVLWVRSTWWLWSRCWCCLACTLGSSLNYVQARTSRDFLRESHLLQHRCPVQGQWSTFLHSVLWNSAFQCSAQKYLTHKPWTRNFYKYINCIICFDSRLRATRWCGKL